MRWATPLLVFLFIATGLAFFIDDSIPKIPSLYPIANPLSLFLSPLIQLLLWPLIYLIAILRRKSSPFSLTAFSVFFAYFGTRLIKIIVGRGRPGTLEEAFRFFVLDSHFDSFPSGHAAISMSLFGSLAVLYPKWRYPLLALGALLPLSRVVLGKHYLSDVIGGEFIGLLTVVLFYHLWNKPLDRHVRSWAAYIFKWRT